MYEHLKVTAVCSHLSTSDDAITAVQEGTANDYGVLLHPTIIKTESGAIVQAEVRRILQDLCHLLSVDLAHNIPQSNTLIVSMLLFGHSDPISKQ